MDRLGGAFQIKTVDSGQRIIAGWAAYHGNIDRVADIIDPAASQKAVARLVSPSEVGVFIGHDLGRLPVGVPIKIEAHPQGLYVETRVFDGPTGDDLLGVARGLQAAGQSLGMSIGYRVHDSRMDRVGGKSIRRLTDYSLREYSFAASQAIANPAALVTGVKIGGSMYTVKQMDGRWHVMKDDKSLSDYATEAEAADKVEQLKQPGDGKTLAPNTLPDSAFLYVAPGGVLDDEGKTVPRTLRHFRIRGSDGALDAEALAVALNEIPQAKTIGLADDDLARYGTRVRRLLGVISHESKTAEDAPEWQSGVAVDLLTVAYGLIDTAERIVDEQQHRRALGEDVKSGWRARPDSAEAITSLAGRLGRIVEQVDLVAQGKDEEALAAWWRAQFELIGVAS